jgi:transposase
MAKRRTYTVEFKQEAVRLVQERGLTITQAGRDLGVCKTVIRDWVKKAQSGELGGTRVPAAESSLEEENRRLRRENAILREEREILKKAAAFFAKETR